MTCTPPNIAEAVSTKGAVPERASATRQWTLRSGWWAVHCSNNRKASACLVGYCGWAGGLGGRCFGGTPCCVRVRSCLYHVLSSGAGLYRCSENELEIQDWRP